MAEPTATLDTLTGQPPPDSELATEQRFAVVPEWMLDADVSDAAFRLYAVLARYGNTSGVRMPGRALLGRRLRKSVDTVDRALRELTAAGVLEIERRQDGNRHLADRYHLRTNDPTGSSRTDAAAPSLEPQVDSLSSRTGAARVAAAMRPNPDVPTETSPPTPANANTGRRTEEDPNRKLLAACGILCLLAALQLAVKVRGWPANTARHALLLVAADPRTRSPMRLAEAGPWWDHATKPTLTRTTQEQAELDGLERLLADCDDRAVLQREARRQLTVEGTALTRLTVARRAARLLER